MMTTVKDRQELHYSTANHSYQFSIHPFVSRFLSHSNLPVSCNLVYRLFLRSTILGVFHGMFVGANNVLKLLLLLSSCTEH